MNTANCVGWWQQRGLGRQPMEDLSITFSNGTIQGDGSDMIGDFELSGTMGEGGLVQIVKQYIGKHSVIYVGQYDGEGTFFGTWLIGEQTGTWSIKVMRAAATIG